MNNEVIQGEMGWWTMKARRDELRLRYWRKIVNMTPERIPRIVYEESRKVGRRTKRRRNKY